MSILLILETEGDINIYIDNNIDNNKDWKAGLFYICENQEKFSLLAANYISNIHSEDLAKRFDRINAMNSKELTHEYNKILFNFSNNDPITTGLGIIDIRRKCGGKVEYYIKKVNNSIDFLTVKVDINKIDYYISRTINKNSKLNPIIKLTGKADISTGALKEFGFNFLCPLPSEFLNVLIGQRFLEL